MERYDYIIVGAGCAGLSLMVHLIHSGKFSNKKILLVDRATKTANDHTWCFWEMEPGLFEPVVSKYWAELNVHFPGFSQKLQIAPYKYKMIRADDFYKYCFELIAQQPNITIKYGEIESLHTAVDSARITLSGQELRAEYIFSSAAIEPVIKQPGKHYLLQHFKGWMIETPAPAFNPDAATFMDFRIPQTAGTSFIYMLPLSSTQAMIEATVFSKELLQNSVYEKMLVDYLKQYFPDLQYKITEEEYGVIPMTNHIFPAADGRIIYLGTAGGKTKASTGYTFNPIQAHSAQLTAQLIATGNPYLKEKKSAARFRFYDRILLHLLANNLLAGDQIFKRLFKRNSPQAIFRFLDNASTVTEELKLTMTLQKSIFLKATIRELLKIRIPNSEFRNTKRLSSHS